MVGLRAEPSAGEYAVLNPDAFGHHIERFNATEEESVINFVSNDESWSWLGRNVPFFECPDLAFEEIYYFRWWSFRKHLVKTPDGFVFTEFLTPVRHAGKYNTISCAAGFHLAEGRWLREREYIDDYSHFWLRGEDGKIQPHFHKFSSWFAEAEYDRFLVNGDRDFVTALLDDLVADYRKWEGERRLPGGLFWQYDVRDGMEESISGSRTARNVRPTINSYMFANARAIAAIARLAERHEVVEEFDLKAKSLKEAFLPAMWDTNAEFFKVRMADNTFSTAREAIGFVPWMFELPDPEWQTEKAWRQVGNPSGFNATFGITTAERRHPGFRTHGFGTCEWDGAVWPFATSQTLSALANVLHNHPPSYISKLDYFEALTTYARSHQFDGKPYIGEYLDETTGQWLKGRSERSRYYNHSTFADLVITGLVGLEPRQDDLVEVDPLLPDGIWDWFCLDGVKYHDQTLTILWDKTGEHYRRGPGLQVLIDGIAIAKSDRLEHLTGRFP